MEAAVETRPSSISVWRVAAEWRESLRVISFQNQIVKIHIFLAASIQYS